MAAQPQSHIISQNEINNRTVFCKNPAKKYLITFISLSRIA